MDKKYEKISQNNGTSPLFLIFYLKIKKHASSKTRKKDQKIENTRKTMLKQNLES